MISSRGFDDFYALLPDPDGSPTGIAISDRTLPEPYRSLLVHTSHMTVTVEQFYGQTVNVRVLESRRDGDVYVRKILLALADSGRVVQFGLVRIDLSVLPEMVGEEIVAGRTPLGRVLIRHDVLRRVEPTGYLEVQPNPSLTGWFGLPQPIMTYGRLGVIYTGDVPAVEVLEILAPITA